MIKEITKGPENEENYPGQHHLIATAMTHQQRFALYLQHGERPDVDIMLKSGGV